MKALVLIFSLFLSADAFSQTRKEKEEALRIRKRNAEIENTTYEVIGSQDCDDATRVTKEIHKLIVDAKTGKDKGAKSLSDLESEYQALKAKQIILNGLHNLNQKYKDFLSTVAGVNGWRPQEGIEADGTFSLKKLKSDIAESQKKIKDAETMAFMDELIKDLIKNHEDLTDPESTKKAAYGSSLAEAQKDTKIPFIYNSISGSKTFSQVKDFCEQEQTDQVLCQVYRGSSDQGKKQIQATVVGFVDAYRMSKRNGLQKAATNNIIRNDLKDYREALLEGIEGATAEKLKGPISEFKKENNALKSLAGNHEANLGDMSADINKYQTCLAAEVLSGSKKDCKLASESSKKYVESLDNIAKAQYEVVQGLGGNNATIELMMEKVHNHGTTKKRLENVKELYSKESEFKKLFDEKIQAEKQAMDKGVGVLLQGILSDKNKNGMAYALGTGQMPKNFAQASQGNAKFREELRNKRAGETVSDLNNKMVALRCANRLKDPSADDKDATTQSQCEEAKKGGDDQLFTSKNGNIEVNPSEVEQYLEELQEGKLAENTKKELDALNASMSGMKEKIDSIKDSKKINTLNRLLAHYGNKAKISCQNHKGKELIKCEVTDSDSNEKVSALVSSTGKILSSMPDSPGSLAISDLNKDCNTEFMSEFEGEAEKTIGAICTAILRENERYTESLKPTADEIRYKKEFSYWDGTKMVTEIRQRDRWMVTQAIAEGAIGFLPSYLDHQIKTTGIETWEASTIEGIKYRNGMLENYYTYGIYGYNGYFGGTPDYLSNWGGSVYNNGFQTVGAGGFFAFTEPAVAPVTAGNTSTSGGFSF